MKPDLVCHLELRPGQEVASADINGHTLHSCSTECQARFLKAPDQFLQTATQAQPRRRTEA